MADLRAALHPFISEVAQPADRDQEAHHHRQPSDG
jgi:hypothetical protein